MEYICFGWSTGSTIPYKVVMFVTILAECSGHCAITLLTCACCPYYIVPSHTAIIGQRDILKCVQIEISQSYICDRLWENRAFGTKKFFHFFQKN